MSSRRKRAAPDQLYKDCLEGRDCMTDVKNKYENTTLADKLLQWFGSILYFGNLGIGSGKGSGGASGYTPIGGVTAPKTTTEVTIARPSVPLDPLGGAEIIPLDVISPNESSIIPLSESGAPSVDIIDNLPAPDMPIGTPEVTTSINVHDVVVATANRPAVINTEEIELVELHPGPPPPKRIALDTSFTSTSSNMALIPDTSFSDPDINVFVDPIDSGDTIGWSDIPLRDIREPSYDTPSSRAQEPISSTPRTSYTEVFRSVTGRARDLYNRYVAQVGVTDTSFLARPQSLVQFGFENPAFEADVSLEFEEGLAELRAAPDTAFQDIRRLGRPRFSTSSEGTVRVSRLGQRGTMTTRSGLTIGQRVHFYFDISDIPRIPESAIELQTFRESSGLEVSVDAMAEGAHVDTDIDYGYSEEALLDPLAEDFSTSQIVLSAVDIEGETLDMPTIPPGASIKLFIGDPAKGVFVNLPIAVTTTAAVPDRPLQPSDAVLPLVGLTVYGDSFFVDPYLLRRRRKHFSVV